MCGAPSSLLQHFRVCSRIPEHGAEMVPCRYVRCKRISIDTYLFGEYAEESEDNFGTGREELQKITLQIVFASRPLVGLRWVIISINAKELFDITRRRIQRSFGGGGPALTWSSGSFGGPKNGLFERVWLGEEGLCVCKKFIDKLWRNSWMLEIQESSFCERMEEGVFFLLRCCCDTGVVGWIWGSDFGEIDYRE